jgi:phenylacetate-coenzyme A ligase PaaK-like adenylate-forming protein
LQGNIVDISQERCDCGSPFRFINKVYGRSGEVQIINGIEKISNTTFGHIITSGIYIDNIAKFQLIQNSLDKVELFIVLFPGKFDQINFEKQINILLNNLIVEYIYVNDIERDLSGKFKNVIVDIK